MGGRVQRMWFNETAFQDLLPIATTQKCGKTFGGAYRGSIRRAARRHARQRLSIDTICDEPQDVAARGKHGGTNRQLRRLPQQTRRFGKGMNKKKRCNDCEVEKPLSKFPRLWNRRKTKKSIVAPYCRPCLVLRTRSWVKKNQKRYNDYQRTYQSTHK